MALEARNGLIPTFFLAGKSADERFERVRLLRVAVAGESSEREDVAWEENIHITAHKVSCVTP